MVKLDVDIKHICEKMLNNIFYELDEEEISKSKKIDLEEMKELANNGDEKAQLRLYGYYRPYDVNEAMSFLEASASHGNERAINLYALYLSLEKYNGIKNIQYAVKLLLSNLSNIGKFIIGIIYYMNTDLNNNYSKSFEYLDDFKGNNPYSRFSEFIKSEISKSYMTYPNKKVDEVSKIVNTYKELASFNSV